MYNRFMNKRNVGIFLILSGFDFMGVSPDKCPQITNIQEDIPDNTVFVEPQLTYQYLYCHSIYKRYVWNSCACLMRDALDI